MTQYDVMIPCRRYPAELSIALQNMMDTGICTRYAYGIESAPTTGMMHYQLKVDLDVPVPKGMTETQVVRQMFSPFHVETSRSDRYDYVYKDGCYFDSDYATGLQFDWLHAQRELISWWNETSDDRSVCVCVDCTGCTGKTWLSRQLDSLGIAVRVPQIPFEKIPGYLLDSPKFGRYVFDLTKVTGKKKLDELMSVVEELKNGCIADWRYRGRHFVYELGHPVHILILCNSLPRSETLSPDRWKIIYV